MLEELQILKQKRMLEAQKLEQHPAVFSLKTFEKIEEVNMFDKELNSKIQLQRMQSKAAKEAGEAQSVARKADVLDHAESKEANLDTSIVNTGPTEDVRESKNQLFTTEMNDTTSKQIWNKNGSQYHNSGTIQDL
jgi:hypothetical protein